MKQKTFIILVIGIILAGGAIGGAFMGGVTLGKNQGQDAALQNMRSPFATRFGQAGTPGATTDDSGTAVPEILPGVFGRGGTMGTVTGVEGDVITLTVRDSTVKVITTADTTVQKMGEGSLNDIKPGISISVTGESQPDGSVKATSVFITQGTLVLPAQP